MKFIQVMMSIFSLIAFAAFAEIDNEPIAAALCLVAAAITLPKE